VEVEKIKEEEEGLLKIKSIFIFIDISSVMTP
jgi:hypothetical protein